ncbi:MAG: YiiD C-terminal domain-containing protein [Opitutaceae bacterium]|nr:YiiD C-terminal domain-containing protein [Opitutaceae bacterium]
MSAVPARAELESYLHDKIPLARAMGVRVEAGASDTLVLTAPLEPNHNHLGTAFGGSLSAMATLAAYSLLWLELGDRPGHIVVHRSEIVYHRPVRGEIRAICRRPADAELAEFRRQFATSGKARIRLGATIEYEGRVCVEFAGDFVALR